MAKVDFSVKYSVTEKGRNSPRYTIDSDLRGEITLEELFDFTKRSLIVIADEVLKEEQAKGFDKNPVTIVDNKRGKPVQSVSPFGKIQFIGRQAVGDILIETYQGIIDRSPIKTGNYSKFNFVFYNGTQIAKSMPELVSWLKSYESEIKDKDFFRFANLTPYARRLERLGVSKGRQKQKLSLSKDKRRAAKGEKSASPNGAYFLTTRAIQRKYKNNSKISFGFISGTQLGFTGIATAFKTGRSGAKRMAKRKKPPAQYLYPSIKILVNSQGVL